MINSSPQKDYFIFFLKKKEEKGVPIFVLEGLKKQ
jgi:hypothetical protein